MASFVALDLTLLGLFLVVAGFFLYRKRENLFVDGPMFLYKTKWGIKLIDKIGKRYPRTIRFLGIVAIILGWILMVLVLAMIGMTIYTYLSGLVPAAAQKAPPIMPLIPYFPQIFGLTSLFPPFYFIYFIVALIIVATVHEFSHGIFARAFGIRIKSTGFAFLKYFPALFGAFVEQDDTQMLKKGRFAQMSVLAAGVFANMIVAGIFFVIMIGTFSAVHSPAGVIISDYAYYPVLPSEIESVNGVTLSGGESLQEISEMLTENQNSIVAGEYEFVGVKGYSGDYLLLYFDSGAINENLTGAITKVGEVEIESREDLSDALSVYSPEDNVLIATTNGIEETVTEITLKEMPGEGDRVWLGIVLRDNSGGIISRIFNSFRDPNVYYETNSPIGKFVYDLIWWIVLINFAVALFNMLPLGILDGGRFFFLGMWSITRSEKLGEKAYKIATWGLLLLFIILMVSWVIGFF